MEHGPFMDGLPIKNGGSFHSYVSHNQRGKLIKFTRFRPPGLPKDHGFGARGRGCRAETVTRTGKSKSPSEWD